MFGANNILSGNMETNSKNVFSLLKKLKFGTSIVHTNMYSHAKVGMQTQTRKFHTILKKIEKIIQI